MDQAAPMVAVVAIAAAVLQENARKGWLAVAATAIVVGGARYFFQISAVQAKAESDKVAAAAAKEKVNATAAAAKLQAAADEVAAAAAKAAAYAAEEALNYDHEPAPAGAATQPVLEQYDNSSSEEDDDVAIVSEPPQFVVCFDFDQCLMKGHWWGKHKNNALDTVNPQPDDFAHDDIGDLFRRLAVIDGVKLAVASFGRHDVIHKAIVSAVGAELADQVYITTPGDFEGYRDGFSMGESFKNAELKKICEDLGVKPEQIIFFDDSNPNITHACDMGVNAFTTAPFTRDHEVHIAAHLGLDSLGKPQPTAAASDAPQFVVCFDFDQCLMKGHWWGKHKNNALDTVNPQPDDFAHDDIGDLFDRLFAIEGVKVAVASFGRQDVIYKAISSVVGDEQADEVYITTPGDFDGYRDGCSMGEHYKNAELDKVCEDLGVQPEQIIFFDDSNPNITHACGMGVNAFTTAPFTRDHEVHIAAHLGRTSV